MPIDKFENTFQEKSYFYSLNLFQMLVVIIKCSFAALQASHFAQVVGLCKSQTQLLHDYYFQTCD